MDVGLVNPFLSATAQILSQIAGIEMNAEKPILKTSPEGKGTVSGVVTLRGNHTGTGSITFSADCILQVVSKMFGEEITDVDDDVKDAVGEITNMICGTATQLYEQDGLGVKAALDQVLMGQGHAIPHLPQLPVLGVPIKSDMGDIFVELCFKE
jgi:chemotaxis protein CheX